MPDSGQGTGNSQNVFNLSSLPKPEMFGSREQHVLWSRGYHCLIVDEPNSQLAVDGINSDSRTVKFGFHKPTRAFACPSWMTPRDMHLLLGNKKNAPTPLSQNVILAPRIPDERFK
jgi:hypothetical protein